MKTMTNIVLLVLLVVLTGCDDPTDPRVNLREGVGSDDIIDNIVTRPVAYAFSALIGEGIEVRQAVTRRNASGFLELHINGYNRSQFNRRFQYRVEWLDENGLMVQTKTSVWQRASAMAKSPFSLKIVAPRKEAVNFRMDTRKWE